VAPKVAAPQQWSAELQAGLRSTPPAPHTLATWWTTLEDPVLSDLIARAITGNPDLKQARARVREARAHRGISAAGRFPTLEATGAVSTSRSSKEIGTGTQRELYAIDFDASWELDVFGGIRRAIEAAQAGLEASEAQYGDVLVSLLAEVALNYIDTRTFQTRLAVAEANLATQMETHQLAVWRFTAGLTTALDVEQATFNLENTRAQIPTLRTEIAQAQHRLAVLLGEPPGALYEQLTARQPIPVTPLDIAVGVPAEVLRRRPDVRRAERQLTAQTARVGVATADLYPRFALLGSIGLEALSLGNLFAAGSRTFSLGPTVAWPIFRAGAIRQNIEVQNALQEQALLQYEATVLAALEEVENALVAYAQEQQRRQALTDATQAAQRAVNLAHNAHASGLSDFLNVLEAERSLLSFQDQLAQSEGQVTSHLIRLYKALGGGWTPLTATNGAP
jgi:NodT family efflux transporter outer membrane factor (OMF) lipoprotein